MRGGSRNWGRRGRSDADAARVLLGRSGGAGVQAAAAWRLWRWRRVPAAGRRRAGAVRARNRACGQGRRPRHAGVARRSGFARRYWADGQGCYACHQAVFRGPLGGRGGGRPICVGPLPDEAKDRELSWPGRAVRFGPLLHQQPVRQADRVQGPDNGRATGGLLPRSVRRPRQDGLRAGAFTLQHEHPWIVAARAPVPVHHPQRRDKHHTRQRQLDDRPPGHVLIDRTGRPHRGVVSGSVFRPERHGQFRQRLGVAAGHGPVAASRADDDDPGGVGRPHPDGTGQEGLLRLPFKDHGTLGRARAHHRRGRGARVRRTGPQRTEAVPLPRDNGRHTGDGVGNRRAGRAAGEDSI